MVVGEEVIFEALVEVPVGAGAIVKVEWDVDAAGDYPVLDAGADGAIDRYGSIVRHAFHTPGTYFRWSGCRLCARAAPPTAELQEMLQDE